jgi:DNA-binding PadR family transcriptional regulator
LSLDHAILGFLNYGPLSGYDLKSLFDISVQHFWPADQSQIYRTLTRLVEQGYVSVEVVEQADRPDRKVHHITQRGQDEFNRWERESTKPRQERVARLMKIFFAGTLSNEQILSLLRDMAVQCEQGLTELEQVPQKAKAESISALVSPREQFFWKLTLEYGQRITEAKHAWLKEVIQRILQGEHERGY